MVFFSCDGCGEMLKKNQVDAHAMRCRRCEAVSCVDCGVSFYGGKLTLFACCRKEMFLGLQNLSIARLGFLNHMASGRIKMF
jgi:hypothetical protein